MTKCCTTHQHLYKSDKASCLVDRYNSIQDQTGELTDSEKKELQRLRQEYRKLTEARR